MSSSPWYEPGRHHDLWKQWRRIGKGQDGRFFLEHRHAVLEALRGHHPPEQVLLSKELYGSDPEFWIGLAHGLPQIEWFLVETERLNQVTSVSNSSGLCGVFSPRPCTLETLLENRVLLVLWEVSDPGNLGTLIRAGRSLCRAGLLLVGGCAVWSSKVARASAGSLLVSQVHQLEPALGNQALQAVADAGYVFHRAVAQGARPLPELVWSGKDAVILGNESRGLPEGLEDRGQPFTIPSAADVESLNVAMSGSIICWEWARSHPQHFVSVSAGLH